MREDLEREVLRLSMSTVFADAVREWNIYYLCSDPGSSCACGHTPITEVFGLLNKFNDNTLEVGNVCVQLFGYPSMKYLFSELSSIAILTKAPKYTTIKLLLDNGLLKISEFDFLNSISGKRKLTTKQSKYLRDILNIVRIRMKGKNKLNYVVTR